MDFINKIIELFSTQKYMNSIFEGLKTTLIISVLAALLGLLLGTIVAIVTISKKTAWTRIPKSFVIFTSPLFAERLWLCSFLLWLTSSSPFADSP